MTRDRCIAFVSWASIAVLAFGASGCRQEDQPQGPSDANGQANTRTSQPESVDTPERPGRIILFSMDTVRADRVSGYGTATTTPNLEEITAEGVRFVDFYAAASFTLPATMSIFTGLDALEHGVWNEAAVLAPDVPTLAELLRKAGYRTQAFHEGGYVDAEFGFDRGFDQYTAYLQAQSRGGISLIDLGLDALGEERTVFSFSPHLRSSRSLWRLRSLPTGTSRARPSNERRNRAVASAIPGARTRRDLPRGHGFGRNPQALFVVQPARK
jgi:hypothetical protein